MVAQLEQLYEGKAKKVFATDNPDLVIQVYKDDATAFNALKKGTITGKGAVNATMTALFMRYLEGKGIKTHMVEQIDERTILTKKVEIVLIEVVTRNRVTGSLQKRTGLPENTIISPAIVEFYYKDDALGDPMINDDHVRLLKLGTPAEAQQLRDMARKINDILVPFFLECGILLVDFKLEFGRTSSGEVILADEISPDTCRFWDSTTLKKMDKDRFRFDLGDVEDAYQEVFRRVKVALGA